MRRCGSCACSSAESGMPAPYGRQSHIYPGITPSRRPSLVVAGSALEDAGLRPVVVVEGIPSGAPDIRMDEVLLHPVQKRGEDGIVDQQVAGGAVLAVGGELVEVRVRVRSA